MIRPIAGLGCDYGVSRAPMRLLANDSLNRMDDATSAILLAGLWQVVRHLVIHSGGIMHGIHMHHHHP